MSEGSVAALALMCARMQTAHTSEGGVGVRGLVRKDR